MKNSLRITHDDVLSFGKKAAACHTFLRSPGQLVRPSTCKSGRRRFAFRRGLIYATLKGISRAPVCRNIVWNRRALILCATPFLNCIIYATGRVTDDAAVLFKSPQEYVQNLVT